MEIGSRLDYTKPGITDPPSENGAFGVNVFRNREKENQRAHP
jgi:hypothetical protein